MARNTLEKVRDCMLTGQPEITWRPEFDRAKEVLERSLLQTASTPARPVAGD
jgi:quinolinate synthase